MTKRAAHGRGVVAAIAAIEVGAFAVVAEGAHPRAVDPGSLDDAAVDVVIEASEVDVMPGTDDGGVPARRQVTGSDSSR
jgi:hypothetical protein